MNHIYRSIWNEKTGTFVAVSECAKTGGKKASNGASVVVGAGFALKALAVSLLLAFGQNSYALPANGTVAAGSATITGGSNNMTINQSSQNAVLNWQSFNIGTGEAVRFVQPNSNSVALNRVLGADATSILGTLSANGKVFIVNPNGILFGKGASVNVGGLVASTLNISDSDFMAGNYKFAGAGNGSILNQGTINADGGYVALLGANVSNEGTINARLGTVALAAGNAITLDVVGDGLLNVTVDQGAVNALVQNGGMIQADGGQVVLTAQAAGMLLQTVVNNTGIIQAQTIENHNGTIKLLGDMQSGTVNVGGKLDASAPNGGNGGAIETSAAHVQINDTARITTAAPQGLTGSWLIDPTDYTIAASGGDITGAALSTNLGSTDITILSTSGGSGSSGNVNVNDSVTWSANKLTLNAQNNININANLNASATASLALEFGQGAVAAGNTSNVLTNGGAAINLPASTTNFTTKQGSNGSVKNYTVITSLGAAGSTTTTDLQGMSGNLGANYALGSNIDATATSLWNAGAGFAPIGDNGARYSGTFDGLGHTISNLTINRPSTSYVGLFGGIGSGATVRNVGMVGGSVAGNDYVGGLVGDSNNGTTSNSYTTGAVSGSTRIGGLVGQSLNSTVSGSHASGIVTGAYITGGLVGSNLIGSTVNNSYATGAVNAIGDNIGGLVGYQEGHIINSHATGTVTGNNTIGGLVGGSGNGGGDITNSYATGAVTGAINVGGLEGFNNYGTISNSYATGAANGNTSVSGLVGYNLGGISNGYATGAVSGSVDFGGLVGNNGGSINHSYFNQTVNSSLSLVGSENGTTTNSSGLTSVQMQTASNFAGFNFTTTAGATGNNWVMVDVDGTLNNAGGALGGTRPMLASEYSTTINNAHQLQLMSMNLAGKYTVGQNINAAVTGTANDVWSGSTFIPVGNNNTLFTGTFNGLGHTINNLIINMPSTSYIGLFGVNGGLIQNIGLVGGSVTGSNYAGGLVGNNANSNALITNSYNTGSVSGSSYLGGIAGQNWSGSITNSYATGAITGTSNNVGGLVGYGHNSATVINSYATGNVVGGASVGGLMGSMNKNSGINNSYATGSVTACAQYCGGLIGVISSGAGVSNSYATGAVNGATQVGGLIGAVSNGTSASNSYATGAVNGVAQVGGLIGLADNAAGASNSYSTGAVTGGSEVGGLIGATGSHAGAAGASNSYWDKQTSGQATSAGGVGATGLTTAQMKTSSSFSGLDLINTWVVYDTYTNPLLRSFMTALTVTANSDTKTYDATAYSGTNGVAYSVATNGNLLGSLTNTGNSQGAVNAGSYSITPGGLYSINQQGGYAITFVSGTLTVNQKALTQTGLSVASSKIYDGTTSATVLGTATLATTEAAGAGNSADGKAYTGDVVAIIGTASGTYNSKDVASANQVAFGGLSVNNSNYTLTSQGPVAATITTKELSQSGLSVASSKVYDGTTSAMVLGTATLATTEAAGAGNSADGKAYTGDVVAITGTASGTYNSKDVASANQVAFAGLSVNNSNYTLTSQGPVAATITAKALTISGMTAANKIYDGNTSATLVGGALNGLIGTETLSFSGQSAAFADKNVGTGKTVIVTGLTLMNAGSGATAGLANNYSINNPTGVTANITRLNSVTWTGGTSGNWFDPANWAGGAVPDLSNVANVVVPTGVTISFNNGSVVAPAQSGTVNVDSIGGAGGMSLVGGNLNVTNTVQLTNLDQSGGSFSSTGNVNIGSFDQTGGALTSTGSFTATNSFSQTGGTLGAGGNVDITRASGSVTLGNINAGGALGVVATTGNITQSAGSSIVTGGTSTLNAPNGNVTLVNGGNSFGNSIVNSGTLTKIQNAVGNIISATKANSNGDSSLNSLVSFSRSIPNVSSGTSLQGMLAGLNVSVTGSGINLPFGLQTNDKTDDKN